MEEEKKGTQTPEEEFITEERLKKAEAYIEEEEGPSRRLVGRMGTFITVVAVIMSLVHLYAAVGVIMTQILRGIHVMFALFLIFLVFPSPKRFRNRILWYDYLLSILAIACIVYVFVDFEDFIYRVGDPHLLGPVFRHHSDLTGSRSDPSHDQLDSSYRGWALSWFTPSSGRGFRPPGPTAATASTAWSAICT